MKTNPNRQRIETESIVLGYAMSRLDRNYLKATGATSWRAAFQVASSALEVPATSFKNLRDEFDPIHSNDRKGWRNRALRPNRQRVVSEFADVSDEALIEFALRIIARDTNAISEAVDALLPVTKVPANVAERLLTGRRAEDFFLENCESLIRLTSDLLIDCRISAKGYDFAARHDDERVFEVKGLKRLKGDIEFTDREWSEARERRNSYVLIVVGNLQAQPEARVIADPHTVLIPKCSWRTTVTASWRTRVSIQA